MLAGSAAFPLLGRERRQTPPPQTDYVPPPRPLLEDAPPFPGPLAFTRQPVTPAVEPFPLSQVRLLPGSMFHDSQEWNRGYMARLGGPAALHVSRQRRTADGSVRRWAAGSSRRTAGGRANCAGISPVTSFLPARSCASTGDKEAQSQGRLHGRGAGQVPGAARRQDISARFRRRGWTGWSRAQRVWAPFYTIHKIMAGMFDMYGWPATNRRCRVLEGMAAWADEWTASKTEEHMQQILTIEFGGIAETLYHLAAATNNDRWAKVGDRFQKKSFINPLALRRDELRGLHVNTHIPQAIAAARRYEISGDPRSTTSRTTSSTK